MNRIKNTFNQGKVFAAYLTAGDGTLAQQLTYVRALLKGGVNLLEIGVPFSDPIADGIIIQRAMQRALNAKTTLTNVLQLIQAIRSESEVPIVLFTYYNPILNAQKQDILAKAKNAGVDGILIIDLPFFEADLHLKTCHALSLAPIAVIAPTTLPSRIKLLSEQGQGFLYYACQKGTTGVRKKLPEDVNVKIAAIKAITDLPIVIGFGIASQEDARAAIAVADGFVVGSYFIEAIGSGITAQELTHLAKAINPI